VRRGGMLGKDLAVASPFFLMAPLVVGLVHVLAHRGPLVIPIPIAFLSVGFAWTIVIQEPLEYALSLPVPRGRLFGRKIALAAAVAIALGALSALAGWLELGPRIVRRLQWEVGSALPGPRPAGPEAAAFALYGQALFAWLHGIVRLPRALDDEVWRFVVVGLLWMAIYFLSYSLVLTSSSAWVAAAAAAGPLYASTHRRLVAQEVTS
jgi:hypothetical protein